MVDVPLIRTVALSKTFGSGHATVRAIDEVSLEVLRGELVLVMGPSGSGKTHSFPSSARCCDRHPVRSW